MNETKEKWRTLIEAMPIGVMLIDCNRTIRDINKSAADMIGRAKEEILGRVCHEFVCPMRENDCPVYDHGKTLDRAEAVLLSKDRGEVAIEKTVTKIVIDSETMLVEMFSDISERKAAEESLTDSEEKYRTFIERTSEGYWGLDSLHKTSEVNPALCDMLGYTMEEMIGRSPHDFVDEENLKIFKYQMGRIGSTLHRSYEIMLKKKSGENIPVWFNATTIVDDAGEFEGAYSLVTDISKRKAAEDALRESEERFRAIFETAQDSIFIKDCSFRYTQANPAMEELFGAPVSELIGRTDDELFGDEAGAHIRDVDSRVLGGEIIDETDTKPVDGVSRTFHTIKVPIRNSSGEVAGLCGIARDITRQKTLEQKLHDSFGKLMKSYEELAIPVIQVHDGVLVIPIMGVLDDMRINRLTETMLHMIADMKSKVVILDLTAVRSIDSAVANRLLETVAAARLLGANCILSGISPGVAAATVRLGLDEMDIVTRGSLQEGLAYAMQRVGRGGLRR